MKTRTTSLHLILAGSIAALLSSPAAFAGNTWDGGFGTGFWSDITNWNADGLPNTGALTFAGNVQNSTNNNLTADLSYAGILFTNNNSVGNTNAFTLAGSRITLGGDITTTALTVNGTITDIISLNMILSGNRIITTNQGNASRLHNLTISGIISEDVAGRTLTKAGGANSILTLSNNNSYTGATTISAGTLILGGTNASTTYNVNAGTLRLEIASGATTPGQIATGAAVNVANGAALNINLPGADSSTTAAVLNNFALNLNGGTSLTFSGQNLGTVTLPGAVTLTGANTVSFIQIRDTLVLGGAIGGTGSITYSGSGLQSSHFVRLTAASNYGGATGITASSAGMTLLLSTGADRLPTSTTLTITGSATAGILSQRVYRKSRRSGEASDEEE